MTLRSFVNTFLTQRSIKLNRFERLRLHISEIEGKVLPAKELSRLLGVSPTIIGSIERGDIPPSKKVATVLEKKYGISKEWFLTGERFAPWEEGKQDDWWDVFEEIKQAVKEGKKKPDAEKLHGGFGALCEILHSSHKKLLDYFIEAGRNPEYREYIYNVIEGGSSKLLEQINQFRARIKELELKLKEARLSGGGCCAVPVNKAIDGECIRRPSILEIKIPVPPKGIGKVNREHWQNNAKILKRWRAAGAKGWPAAMSPPSWVLEKFCREDLGLYLDRDFESMGELLWGFINEGKKC